MQVRLRRMQRRRERGQATLSTVPSTPTATVLHRMSLRIVTMPIQSQGIITRDT